MRNGLVEGVTLRAVLRESGAMAPEAAASVLAGMLMTLAVVHGDVRPEHVRVDGSGGLALTGFGGEDARFVPNEPTYLAPERLTGTPPDAGGDVFSATAVFFECLTSEAPFVAATGDDLAALHEYAEVIAEFAPPELRTLTQHGLAPDPQRRPTSPHGFLAEVTGTATEVYGSDWQARGRALLSGWAADAARADGLELAAAPGRSDAPARAAAMAASEGAPEGAGAGAVGGGGAGAAAGAAEGVAAGVAEGAGGGAAAGAAGETAREAAAAGEAGEVAAGEAREAAAAGEASAAGEAGEVAADSAASAAGAAEAVEAVEAVEAPPVGEPIDAALLGLDDVGGLPGVEAESAAESVAESAGDEEMPPPVGEPIDETLLGLGVEDASDEDSFGEDAFDEEPKVDEPADMAAPEQAAETPAEDTKDYDWFTGSSKASAAGGEALGAEADVLSAFGRARAPRPTETPEPYRPSGFDVFAGRSGGTTPAEAKAEAETDSEAGAEPVTGHWDVPEADEAHEDHEEPVPDTEPVAGGFEAFAEQAADIDADSPAEQAEAVEDSAEQADADDGETNAEANAETNATADDDTEFEPLIEDSSELLAAFDAFSVPPAAPEPEPEPEPEPLPKRDPFAGLRIETLAASSLAEEASEPEAKDSSDASSPDADSSDTDSPEADPTATTTDTATDTDTDTDTAADTSADTDPESGSPADFEDDWIFPTKPSPKVPRSLSAFAVSLPSLPRPQAEADEPKAPVQTSAPDDWFRPGVAEPAEGEDAQHTQVLNPDRDNTLEREATRTFDQVSDEGAAEVAAAAEEGVDGDGDDPVPADDAPAGPGGPRRKTLIGAVTTAVLLVAGATAVVLSGPGKTPQGTGTTPTETSSSSIAPSPTGMPTTPVGTSSQDSTTSSSSPSSHHSSTHSRSKSSTPSTSSHSSSDETPTRSSSSSSDTPSSPPSSSTTSTSSAPTTASPTCTVGILGICEPTTSTSKGQGGN